MKSNIPINFTKDEISTYIKRFRSLDTSNKGYITNKELKAFFKVIFINLFFRKFNLEIKMSGSKLYLLGNT